MKTLTKSRIRAIYFKDVSAMLALVSLLVKWILKDIQVEF